MATGMPIASGFVVLGLTGSAEGSDVVVGTALDMTRDDETDVAFAPVALNSLETWARVTGKKVTHETVKSQGKRIVHLRLTSS